MEDKTKDGFLPITFDDWDEAGDFLLQFYNVVFTEDLRDVKKGQCFHCISMDFSNGVLETYDDKGFVLSSYKLKLI